MPAFVQVFLFGSSPKGELSYKVKKALRQKGRRAVIPPLFADFCFVKNPPLRGRYQPLSL